METIKNAECFAGGRNGSKTPSSFFSRSERLLEALWVCGADSGAGAGNDGDLPTPQLRQQRILGNRTEGCFLFCFFFFPRGGEG